MQDAPEIDASCVAVTLIEAPFIATDVEPLTVTLGEVRVASCDPLAVRVDPDRVKPCVAPILTVWLPVMVMALEELILKTPVDARVVPFVDEVLIC